MLTLDGTSGGGQVLRTALGLSVVTQTPFTLANVRGGRSNPGLQTQHLESLKAIALLCNAEVTGAQPGSKEVVFKPRAIDKTKLNVEIGTAGSVGLVFQTLQLVPRVLNEPLVVRVCGGATYGKWAPPVDYLTHVFLPVMKRFGYHAEIKINKHGFYPKGGADVEFTLHQWKPTRIRLVERGELESISIVSIASTELQKNEVAERQAKAAKHALNAAGLKAEVVHVYEPSLNAGSGIVCYAEYEHTVLGGDAIGERNVRAEDVGKTAAQNLLEAVRSNAALDDHASDMILPFLALSGGEVLIEKETDHVKTNTETIEAFLPGKIKFDGTRVTSSL